MKSLILLAVACLVIAATGKNYEGAQLLEIVPATKIQVEYLRALRDEYDFWIQPSLVGNKVRILATQSQLTQLKKFLTRTKISFNVVISDVQQVLAKEKLLNDKALQNIPLQQRDALEWTAYHTYDEIVAWCRQLALDYPSLVTTTTVGTSFEGLDMILVKVAKGGVGNRGLFIDAGIHAREWISPATVTWMMNELVTNSANYDDTLSVVDFYFMPLINPDGYSWTWTATENRLWRKTRSINPDSICLGCDPNRNWSYHWGDSGSSERECSEIYAGSEAFSEVEMQAVRDQMNVAGLQIYLTYHSYGLMMLYPWGYADLLAPGWEEMKSLGDAAAAAIIVPYGTEMAVENSGDYYGAAAGASDDYAKGVPEILYSYTLELRAGNTTNGQSGFELPPEEIIPCSLEQFEGFKVFFEHVRDTPT